MQELSGRLRGKAERARRRAPFHLAGRPSRRPIAVVHGNCQAEPIRALLADSPSFAEAFHLVAVPAVQSIPERDLAPLSRLLARTSLLITQEVRDDYRDLPVGTRQVVAHLPSGAEVVRYPVLYYEGLHPTMVYVRAGEALSTPAPLTDYHDLRILHAAARRMSVDVARAWLEGFAIPADAVRRNAEASLAELARREADLDVAVAGLIARDPRAHGRSFFTVNHPANRLLLDEVRQILDHLGLAGPGPTSEHAEHLAVTTAPVDGGVARALGLVDPPGGTDWVLGGRVVPVAEVLGAHLEWYRAHPEVVAAGRRQHAGKLADLGLD